MPLTTAVIAAAAGLLVTVVLAVLIRSRFIRARLLFSAALLVVSLGLDTALAQGLGDQVLVAGLARLTLVLALLTAIVALVVNPWKASRPSERMPAIVQDAVVLVLFGVIATLIMREQLLATSAVGAVVVGFALQDTLGNLFAGLAIQIEKPFRVGQWVSIGGHEGRVEEVTWRATKLHTKMGQFLIVPNSSVAKDVILNYSEPVVPTRLEVTVGVSYLTPPHVVKEAIGRALDNAPLVNRAPAPLVTIDAFSASSVDYGIRFWIDDYGADRVARDQVRSNLWYEFRRSGIEMPWPIQVEYSRPEPPAQTAEDEARAAEVLGRVALFSHLPAALRQRLATARPLQWFARSEAIVRQGASGRSLFVVLSGDVAVVLEPSQQEVATISAGGVFGEMSALTGAPRTATVRALSACQLLEITAESLADLLREYPDLLDPIGRVIAERRTGLAEAQQLADAADAARVSHTDTLLERIQRFLKL